MCLTLGKDKRVRFTTKDKVVFKRLVSTTRPNVFRAPLQEATYRLGKIKTARRFTGWAAKEKKKSVSFDSEIPKGTTEIYRGIHSFKTLYDAEATWISGTIVKCIIPKGTAYINGTEGHVVSLAIIPIKKAY